MSLFGPKQYLGVDIGTVSVKAVQVSKQGERAKLDTYGEIKLAPEEYGDEMVQSSALKMIDERIVEMLKEVLSVSQAKARDATFSIPIFSSFSTLIEMPEMSQKELAKAVPYEAGQYIPVPISEVALDWAVVGESAEPGGARKIQILLVAVPKEIVSAYTKIAQAVGLNLKALEIESFALARAAVGNDQSVICVLDIGHRSTDVSIVDRGFVKITHNFDFAGAQITNILAQAFGIDKSRATALKEERGLEVSQGEKEIIEVVSPTLDLIVSEINQVINDYFKKSGRKVEKIILSGGTANMPGVMKYFSQAFGLSIYRANPFSRLITQPVLSGVLQEIGPIFSIAVGLALREF